jgi:hypothetical protein
MAELNFDANVVEPVGSFDVLPVGDYLVIISASEKKATKDNDGEYVQFTYDVIEGEYKGRKVFDRLNLINKNPTAQKIAQGSLSAICHVTGVMHPKMTEELHGKPLMIKVGIRPAKDQYAESNVVKEYKFSDGRRLKDELSKSPAKKAETTAAPDGKKKKPWEKS